MSNNGAVAEDDIAGLSLSPPQNAEPPPQAVHPVPSLGRVGIDITRKFSETVRTLSPGEIVKYGFFTLFDAVSALEIMDLKMDSGCVKPGDEFEELYDVKRPLLEEEILGIIDELLCHEMSWHLGYPLSQTVFTSVYVEALSMPDPHGIEAARFDRASGDGSLQPLLQVLRAYCLGMLKACGYVNERITSEHFYEEEDFVTNTYNRTLLSNVPTPAIKAALADARDFLKSQRIDIGDDLANALDSRLELRQILLEAVNCPQHRQAPELAKQPWQSLLSLLPSIGSTHHLAKPVEEAFSAKLQRKLASTMPPRPIVVMSFSDAFKHLLRLVQDGLEVIGVLDFVDSQCLQNFVTLFQAKKPQPLIFNRTLLQTFLFGAVELPGPMNARRLLEDDLSIMVLPASPLLDPKNDGVEAVHDPRHAAAQQMQLFRRLAEQPFLEVLRTACQNRCRVRRTLCHIIRDWEAVQSDAEGIDSVLQYPTIRQMETIVQLGFELEIYQADELVGMYWYLNYLSRTRLHHTERIRELVVRSVEALRSRLSKLTAAAGEQMQRSLSYSHLSLLDAAVTWQFSDALSCLYTVLLRLGLIKTPSRPYSRDEYRYDLRMRPFACIGFPELPTFEQFTAGVKQSDSSSEELLLYGERAAGGAKKGLEVLSKLSAKESFSIGSHERWTAWVKNVLKSSIALSIAISSVQKALKGLADGKALTIKAEIPSPYEAYHEWWIVPKISTQN